MKQNLPSHFRSLPNGQASALTYLVLNQRVRQKINFSTQSPTVKATRLPHILMWIPMTPFQFVQHILSGITLARSADLPEIAGHHAVEISPRHSQLRPMEDRFALPQLLENAQQIRIGREGRFHLKWHPFCRKSPYRITLPGTIGSGASLSNCIVNANISVYRSLCSVVKSKQSTCRVGSTGSDFFFGFTGIFPSTQAFAA